MTNLNADKVLTFPETKEELEALRAKLERLKNKTKTSKATHSGCSQKNSSERHALIELCQKLLDTYYIRVDGSKLVLDDTQFGKFFELHNKETASLDILLPWAVKQMLRSCALVFLDKTGKRLSRKVYFFNEEDSKPTSGWPHIVRWGDRFVLSQLASNSPAGWLSLPPGTKYVLIMFTTSVRPSESATKRLFVASAPNGLTPAKIQPHTSVFITTTKAPRPLLPSFSKGPTGQVCK